MKPVDELLEAARATLTTSSQTQLGEPVEENTDPSELEGRRLVRMIFATLKTAFPAWYEKHYGDAKAEQLARRVWLSVVKDIGEVAVSRGLHRMVQECKFPPSPKDFVDLCSHVDGLPTIGEAWDQALMGNYLHEAVRIAAEATSTFDLRTAKQGDKALFQRFERNYAIVMRRAQTGQPLNGRISHGIAHDSMRDRRQVQLEQSRKEIDALVIQQGIPTNGKSARELLLAKMGIRSDRHA